MPPPPAPSPFGAEAARPAPPCPPDRPGARTAPEDPAWWAELAGRSPDAEVDTVVVGAGVVGLAVARALAQPDRPLLILEAEPAFGTGVSSRNSEVIHAGLYYPPGSLRAELCVRGKALLYAFCAAHGVAHRRCGKLIVATEPAEAAALERIRTGAEACGVHDLRWLSADEARRLEPALRCEAALLSPSTGIIDSHGLMLALLGAAEARGATLACRAPVQAILGIEPGAADGFRLQVGGEAPMTLAARRVVNAAGLGAPALGRSSRDAQGQTLGPVPDDGWARGRYFALPGRSPFSHLVYPAPGESGHLGVHLTLDLGGQARFGPDFEWVDGPDFAVDPAAAQGFYAAVRRYWPQLPDGALQPAYAGIRPKISRPGEPAADFRIDGPAQHGRAGLVQLFGLESPGLTASLAIAERVAAALGD